MPLTPSSPHTFEEWTLVFLTPWSEFMIATIAVALAVAWALTLWTFRRVRLTSFVTIAVLRLATLGSVGFLLLQPAAELRRVTEIPNRIAVLLDRSSSMNIADGSSSVTRDRRLWQLLQHSQDRLTEWEQSHRVDIYEFGSALTPLLKKDFLEQLKGDPKETPQQRTVAREARAHETRFDRALASLQRETTQGPISVTNPQLGGVVILSDGIDTERKNAPQLTEAERTFIKEMKCPIHTIWVGDSRLRDLAVTELHLDEFAFVRTAMEVDVEITAADIDPQPVSVKLWFDERLAAEQIVNIDGKKRTYTVSFRVVPERVGTHVVKVETPILKDEAITTNNARSRVLNVIRDRTRVLHVAGRPSWDVRFLRQWLKRDPNVDLVSFFILRTPASTALVPTDELSLIPFPTKELFETELGSFDVVILHDFNFEPYGIGQYLPQLKHFVLNGGGLAMIGGELSFSAGGYATSPLAEILPTELPPSGDIKTLLYETPFRLRVTEEGKVHPILSAESRSNDLDAVLGALPLLDGGHRLGRALSQTTLLAVHPQMTDPQGAPMPVIATRSVEKGRTLAIATDALWRWAFLPQGEGDSRRIYDLFWRNALRWLAHDPELSLLRVVPRRARVRSGESIEALLRLFLPNYTPAARYEIEWHGVVEQQPQSIKKILTDERGEALIQIPTTQSGVYRLIAKAIVAGKSVQSEAVVIVEAGGKEMDYVVAEASLLQLLAKQSGGTFLDKPDRISELAFPKPASRNERSQKQVALSDQPLGLGLMVLLLAIEWWVRRRLGKV